MSSPSEIEEVRQAHIAPRFIQHNPVLLAFGAGAYIGGHIIAPIERPVGLPRGRVARPGGTRWLIRTLLCVRALAGGELIRRMLARGFTGTAKHVFKELHRLRQEGVISRHGARGRYVYALKDPSLTADWHGTLYGYNHHRCRCPGCRGANQARSQRRRRGNPTAS
jgi:hypothetical protein